MDTGTIYHHMITVINVAILVILVRSFIKHHTARKNDVNFHSRMLLLCTCLLLANTFALITGLYAYYVLKVTSVEVINLGRFADRYCMFFAYLALDKIDERY